VSANPGAGQRAEKALLANPGRSNSDIAAEVNANFNTVIAVRRRLAAAGLVPPMREQPMIRAARELRADPARSDSLISELAGVNERTIARVRHQLEAEGQIPPAPQRVRVPRPMKNAALRPQARERAATWLKANPARTDQLLGRLARCSPGTVMHVRRELEQAGEIERVPVHLRAAGPPGPAWKRPEPAETAARPPRPDLSAGFCSKLRTGWWASDYSEHRELALHLCELCPLLDTCREWALKLPDQDRVIYGGLTLKERQVIRRSQRKGRRSVASHLLPWPAISELG
jgi:DNA-binding transcriptional regulator YhcF (GntR family)